MTYSNQILHGDQTRSQENFPGSTTSQAMGKNLWREFWHLIYFWTPRNASSKSTNPKCLISYLRPWSSRASATQRNLRPGCVTFHKIKLHLNLLPNYVSNEPFQPPSLDAPTTYFLCMNHNPRASLSRYKLGTLHSHLEYVFHLLHHYANNLATGYQYLPLFAWFPPLLHTYLTIYHLSSDTRP